MRSRTRWGLCWRRKSDQLWCPKDDSCLCRAPSSRMAASHIMAARARPLLHRHRSDWRTGFAALKDGFSAQRDVNSSHSGRCTRQGGRVRRWATSVCGQACRRDASSRDGEHVRAHAARRHAACERTKHKCVHVCVLWHGRCDGMNPPPTSEERRERENPLH